MATMVETKNVEWDVVDVGSSFVATGIGKNLFQPLNYSVIDKQGLIPESVNEPSRSASSISRRCWPTARNATRPACPSRGRTLGRVTKFPGVRAMRKISYNTTREQALMADGAAEQDVPH